MKVLAAPRAAVRHPDVGRPRPRPLRPVRRLPRRHRAGGLRRPGVHAGPGVLHHRPGGRHRRGGRPVPVHRHRIRLPRAQRQRVPPRAALRHARCEPGPAAHQRGLSSCTGVVCVGKCSFRHRVASCTATVAPATVVVDQGVVPPSPGDTQVELVVVLTNAAERNATFQLTMTALCFVDGRSAPAPPFEHSSAFSFDCVFLKVWLMCVCVCREDAVQNWPIISGGRNCCNFVSIPPHQTLAECPSISNAKPSLFCPVSRAGPFQPMFMFASTSHPRPTGTSRELWWPAPGHATALPSWPARCCRPPSPSAKIPMSCTGSPPAAFSE